MIGPEAGAIVMGTGIVSIALLLDHHRTLSRILLVVALIAWIALAIHVCIRLISDRTELSRQARTPVALTAAAGTAVIGSRLLAYGLHGVALALLILAAASWLGLSGAVVTARPLPATGSSFLLVVSTQSVAALAASLSVTQRADWLAIAAAALCALGIVEYPFVFARFDRRQLLTGAGDHWVAGGAVAVSVLASSAVSLASRRAQALHGLVAPARVTADLLWIVALIWLAVLVVAEVAAPRPQFDIRRWATVFPLGMYAACAFELDRAAHLRSAHVFASLCTWVAAAVWAAVALGTARQARAALESRPRE